MQPPTTTTTTTTDLTQQHHHQQQQWLAMQQYQQQQQQQWLAMQQQYHHPAAAMMYQQPPPPPPYMPYHYQQQFQQQYQTSSSNNININNNSQVLQGGGEDNKTVWVGDLHHWMDETYLQSCFSQIGEVQSIKIIRNRQTGQSERYGFVEFQTHSAAEKAIQSCNGTMMPNTDQVFRLNWASFSTGEKRGDIGSDLSIFVGDLAPNVTDSILLETFASRYPSVKGAKVVVDTNTMCSKGYGFVRFSDESERSKAMNEMNGQYCSSRPMRIGVATPKKLSGQQQYGQPQFPSQAVILAGGNGSFGVMPQNSQSDEDTSNTTIFVGGLDSEVNEEDLRQAFIQCGEILSIKIPIGKGCGFVRFANRSSAEDAIQNMHGTVIGKQTVRISWGKTPASRQRMDSNGKQGYGGGGYGYGYGYGMGPNQDSGVYVGEAGSGYVSNGYGNHQQPVS
ncbi:polyadenylate-binding protein RBP47-like [Bidens hawaiensis]|uniref:polyadenylate-binding protein RBP47-like n=1 Tax=Bidens hawaiensis TaxID=980011 RepID=UPI00404A48A8